MAASTPGKRPGNKTFARQKRNEGSRRKKEDGKTAEIKKNQNKTSGRI